LAQDKTGVGFFGIYKRLSKLDITALLRWRENNWGDFQSRSWRAHKRSSLRVSPSRCGTAAPVPCDLRRRHGDAARMPAARLTANAWLRALCAYASCRLLGDPHSPCGQAHGTALVSPPAWT